MSRIITSLLFCFLLAVPSIGQTAEDLFQQAIRVERLSGNTEAAIALYQQIVDDHSSNRSATARALLQIGKAYEILGRDEAQEAYGVILRDYSDIEDVVEEAAARIAAVDNPAAVSTTNAPGSKSVLVLESGRREAPDPLYGAAMSPDGRYVVRGKRGSDFLHIDDLFTGRKDSITVAKDCTWQYTSRFSPDGKTIAFTCYQENDTSLGLYDTGNRTYRTMFSLKEYFDHPEDWRTEMEVHDWSQDGSAVLVSAETFKLRTDIPGIHHMVLVPLNGARPTVIDPEYGEYEFWETEACLLRNGRFMFGHYGFKTWDIHRIDTKTGERMNVLSSDGTHYQLFDCLKESNTLIFSREVLEPSVTSLYAASVSNTGGLGTPRLLTGLPNGGRAVPGARDGNIYFGEGGILSANNFVGHANLSADLSGISTLTPIGKQRWTASVRWSPDGDWIMNNSLGRVSVTNTDDNKTYEWRMSERTGKVMWSPDGTSLMSSFPFRRENGPYFGTTVFDIKSGEVTQRVDSLGGIGWLPGGQGFYFAHEGEKETCIRTYEWTGAMSGDLACMRLPVSTYPYWWAVAPNGTDFAAWTRTSDDGDLGLSLLNIRSGVSSGPTTVAKSARYSRINWSQDSNELRFSSRDFSSTWIYDVESQEWTSVDLGDLLPVDLTAASISPDGKKVVLAGRATVLNSVELRVLHNPPGLLVQE